MIDSIAIEHRYTAPLSPEHVQCFRWRMLFNPHNGSLRGFIHEGKKGSHLPTMTFNLRENGFWYLRAEVSLPKWLNGTNVRSMTASEILLALERLSNYVSELSGKKFDAITANVARVDFVEDKVVFESQVIPFFKRVWNVSLQTMIRQTFEDTTIYFQPRSKSKYKVIKIYSKLHEVLEKKGSAEEIELARGQIRLEILLRTKAINLYVKKLNLSSREARVFLVPEVAEYVLAAEKQKLKYDSLFKEEKDTLQILMESPHEKNIFSLYGFAETYRHLGKNFHKLPSSKCSKRTYHNYLSKCLKLGLLP
jgi:hypothetical protein